MATMAPTNGWSPKHLDRYVDEFSGRHNIRSADTIDQMRSMARGMLGQRLRYRDLIAPNGRPSGASDHRKMTNRLYFGDCRECRYTVEDYFSDRRPVVPTTAA